MSYADTETSSGHPRWGELRLGSGLTDAGSRLLITPDASGLGRYFYLPFEPRLNTRPDGKPVFSLTVILTRSPKSGEDSIFPLIDHSLFAAALTLALRPEEVALLPSQEYTPLFARNATFLLGAPGAEPLASTDAGGPEPTVALSATFDRDQTIEILSALDGRSSQLQIEVDVQYVAGTGQHTTTMNGSWASVYDVLAANASLDRNLSLDKIKTAFTSMLNSGTITLAPSGAETDQLFPSFLRTLAFILQRETPSLGAYDPRNLYSLRKRPNANMRLNVSDSVSGPILSIVTISAPLDAVLAPLSSLSDLGDFVRLVAPDPAGSNEYIDVPRLTTATRNAPGFRGASSAAFNMVLSNGDARSLSLEMMSDRSAVPNARALLASDAVVRRPQYWLANDLVLHNFLNPSTVPLSLPILDDNGVLWRDRVTASRYWYAPSFTLVKPEPNAVPDSSPFLFSYTQNGVIGGVNPRPGLNGTVRFTLQKTMPDSVQIALQSLGNPAVAPVPTENLAVSLELPFRDASSGAIRTQLFPATLQDRGDTVTATVDLLDDWVRLSYGALAYANFQAQPPRIAVSYAYRGYTIISANGLSYVVAGGKIAQIGVADRAEAVPQNVTKPVFNLAENKLHLPMGVMQFAREAPITSFGSSPARTTATRAIAMAAVATQGGRISHGILATPAATVPAIAAQPLAAVQASAELAPLVRPQLEYSPALIDIIRRVNYALTSAIQDQRTDALFPCSTYGNFYVQLGPSGLMPIGCQDALRLGEVAYKQFEEIAELATPRYKVYRSLQQPGRYLIMPAGYRITRYASTEGADKAYRPVILLYGVLDPDPSKNRYYFRATLQPDIPYADWRQLQEKLIPYAPSGRTPQIEFPTDPAVQATTTYAWSVPTGINMPEAQQMWDGFQVSISADLTDSLFLKNIIDTTGVTAAVTFQLPDGLTVTTHLTLDTLVAGPWNGGPVSVALGSGVATLTNNIEQPVSVSDLYTVSGTAPAERSPVNTQIVAHGSVQVPLTSAASDSYVAHAPLSAHLSLQELDIFSEDVVTHVIFVNQITYANHSLNRLDGKLKLKNVDHVYAFSLTEGQSSSVDITLPLATYLENQAIQFQVTIILTTGPVTSTPWFDWDLQAKGNIVGLTWDLIQ